MPRGRKFDAAEKHFEKKKAQLEKEVKYYQNTACQLRKENEKLKLENDFLKGENDRLNHWIERLLEYTELSKEDIREACEKDKHIGSVLGAVRAIGGF